ncbi:FHA domain-containing protein [sulfur-oxidizing endosymbiont of Gigantopelta aegis]|uniref:FHA domain-containing protein n=1 Tax=sulfur-oxidizing endosymbiont of Gigantopelta aegis TaxID=2794934 RepID=UPI0018DBC559|nr:FHA domain-containing protein [sulfur-oxidizing endosymbiont of Gigantopelta aegis]
MSQVSLLFKDRILSVNHLDQNTHFIIGHAPECQIHIDSLAVSPHHARITYEDRAYTIEELGNETDILINNKKIDTSAVLSDGDQISLGKHTLIFTFDERNENREFREPEPPPVTMKKSGKGWVQYLNGLRMGKTIQIKKNMTNISDDKAKSVALISNRADGFYISYLKGASPKVNNAVIGEKSTLLPSNSRISLGSQDILFYIE